MKFSTRVHTKLQFMLLLVFVAGKFEFFTYIRHACKDNQKRTCVSG